MKTLREADPTPLRIQVTTRRIADGLLRRTCRVRNTGARPVPATRLAVWRATLNGARGMFAGARTVRFFQTDFRLPGMTANFGCFGPRGINHRQPHERDDSWLFEESAAWTIRSDPLLALATPDRGKLLLLGAGTFRCAESEILLRADKRTGALQVTVFQDLDGLDIAPGQDVALEDILQFTGTDLNALLQRWAEHTAHAARPRPVLRSKIPAGWIGWQYFRGRPTRATVLRAARRLARLRREGFPLEYVLLDQGFCRNYTEWEQPTARYPGGVAALVPEIERLGLKTGLWFAPYTQNTRCRVVREHPEWLLRDALGKPVVARWSNAGRAHLLDYSIPQVENWLRRQVRLLTREWGIRWIKIDGPRYSWYRQGRLRNRRVSLTAMFCRTLEIMREEAGPEVILEGEGPLGVALGKVDLHRVQGDNQAAWLRGNDPFRPLSAKTYARELLLSFLHRRWWLNHRQDVILRDFPAPGDPLGGAPVLNRDELNTHWTAAIFGSGAVLLCDPLDKVLARPYARAVLEQLFPIRPDAAEIMDAFPDRRWPSVFRQPRGDTWSLAVINWDDAPRVFSLPRAWLPAGMADLVVRDFFGPVPYKVQRDRLVLEIPAHGAAMVERVENA